VLCRWGYMLMLDPETALRETRRVLRPGGHVALAAWAAPEENPNMTLAPKVVQQVRERGMDIPVVVGGIIPDQDAPKLVAEGVAAVLTPGASSDEVVSTMRRVMEDGHPAAADG